jgi:hypothetical protein
MIIFLKILKIKHRGWNDAYRIYVVQDGVQGLTALNRTMNFHISLSGAGSAWGGHLESLYGFRQLRNVRKCFLGT